MFPENTHIAMAQPLSWPYLHADTYLSLMSIYRPQKFTILASPRGGDIAEKREMQSQAGLDIPDVTHIVYLDGDMVFPQKALVDMIQVLEDGADLAGIVCYRGYPPYDPLIWHPKEDRLLEPFKEYQLGDLVDAGATGAACLMVKREVLEKLPRPWFQIVEKEEDGVVIRRGEDTYFTRKATDAGFKLKIITEYDVGHLRDIRVDREFWMTYNLVARIVKKEGWKGVFQRIKEIDE